MLKSKPRAIGLDEASAFLGDLAGPDAGPTDAADVLAVEQIAAQLRSGGMTAWQSVRQALRARLRQKVARPSPPA